MEISKSLRNELNALKQDVQYIAMVVSSLLRKKSESEDNLLYVLSRSDIHNGNVSASSDKITVNDIDVAVSDESYSVQGETYSNVWDLVDVVCKIR
jgi:hypothetical protein